MKVSKIYNKYRKYFVIAFLIIVLVSLLGGTHAMFQRIDEAEFANNYQTGNLQIEYTGLTQNIDLVSQAPISDSAGMASTPYQFMVKNVGNLKYKFSLKVVVDSEYVEEHGCAQNLIPSNYLKISFNGGTPVLLSDLTDNVFISDLTFEPQGYAKYNIRIWIAEGAPNEIMGKHFHGKIVSEGSAVYNHDIIGSEPNAPVLADGMIPIKYDGTNWVKADTTNQNNTWYNYGNKMWANAVMVKSSSLSNDDYYLDDLSGNNYDAKLMNGAKVVTIGGQKAIELDGVDDYIEVPTLPASIGLTNGYTVEVTMQWKTLGSYARIMDFGNGASSNNLVIANWGTYSTPYVAYYNGASSSIYPYISFTFTANTKQTYKFVLTKGSSYYTLEMYLNNSLEKTSTSHIPVGAFQDIQRTKNYIGKSNWSDPYLSAYIYDFKILDSTGKAIISYDADNVIRPSYGNTTLSDGTLCTGTDNSCTREDYMNAKVGVEIPEEDILAYYVWIPRYKYQLFNPYFESVDSQLINVEFESGTASTGTVTCSVSEIGVETCTNKANGNWYTHPAFTFGDQQLQGIWVGKFETTYGTNTTNVYPDNTVYETPTIKPNVTSLRKQQLSKQFETAQYFGTSAYLTSTGVNEVDAHMMKNIEWGAVAYLKQSAYGLGTTDITLNSNNSYLTGCGPQSAGSTSSGSTCNAYHTTLGMSASTTGNITGVYDMSGGAYEYTMGVIQDNTITGRSPMSGYSTSYNSGYIGKVGGSYDDSGNTLAFPAVKYYDLYAKGTNYNDHTRSHLGDATGETNWWYSDYPYFPYVYAPWFKRGGYWYDGSNAGVFHFRDDYGNANTYYGFRVALSTTGA